MTWHVVVQYDIQISGPTANAKANMNKLCNYLAKRNGSMFEFGHLKQLNGYIVKIESYKYINGDKMVIKMNG